MDISVDVSPDQIIDWFAVYPEAERGRVAAGECPHDCPHTWTMTVAWGADLAHYELHVCQVREGCDGNCRGWLPAEKPDRELWDDVQWKLLAPHA